MQLCGKSAIFQSVDRNSPKLASSVTGTFHAQLICKMFVNMQKQKCLWLMRILAGKLSDGVVSVAEPEQNSLITAI